MAFYGSYFPASTPVPPDLFVTFVAHPDMMSRSPPAHSQFFSTSDAMTHHKKAKKQELSLASLESGFVEVSLTNCYYRPTTGLKLRPENLSAFWVLFEALPLRRNFTSSAIISLNCVSVSAGETYPIPMPLPLPLPLPRVSASLPSLSTFSSRFWLRSTFLPGPVSRLSTFFGALRHRRFISSCLPQLKSV